ncbi:MAG: ribosome assembly cofactor RimP [Bacteroidales bacterium]|jgi:ribosome maturation factor RimP
MADQNSIEHHLEGILAGKDIFLVGVKVDNNNKIIVHIDTSEGISIDDCARVSRELEEKLDRDREDFALEVSSPGLDSPFRVIEQYQKNVGKRINLVKTDGEKLEGVLKKTGENGIVLEMTRGRKGQPKDPELLELSFAEIKSGRVSIQF